MLTIKSDDVYGRAKAYESIIKDEPIVGPKLPESFNVLVKELQGLGLRVDLVDESEAKELDADHVIAASSTVETVVPTEEYAAEEIVNNLEIEGDLDDEGISLEELENTEDNIESAEEAELKEEA
jgi:DNA-directed RNA polymerase subunit beta